MILTTLFINEVKSLVTFALLGWLVIITVLLFTQSLNHLLAGNITLSFTTNPDLSSFFHMYSLFNGDINFVLQKAGHFGAFFLLAFLCVSSLKRVRPAFVFCSLFGILTEVFQPFFYRDGRFLDIVINLCGILSYLLFYFVYSKLTSLKTRVFTYRRSL
jgi:VanZ family protein